MFTLSECLITVLTVFIVIYYYVTRKSNYFKERQVNFIKPLPFVGNMFDVIFSKRNLPEIFQSLYDKFPKSSYFGFFEFTTPVYVIRDPEIIKKITLKDFDHFVNHRITLDRDNEPIFSRFLFFARNRNWKDMRSTMSPAFTGCKMRKMFNFINEYVEQLCVDMIEKITGQEIELKDFYSRIGSDVNATCAFGLNVNSFKDEKNQFFTEVAKATDFRGFQALKFFLTVSFPAIMKLLRTRILNKSTLNYMRRIVGETVNYRQANNIIRQDMIHLVMEAMKGKLKHSDSDMKYDDAGFATVTESEYGRSISKMEWEDDDCVAQCFQFLIAGYDTTSAILSFTTHELAINPNVQEKLIQEIDEVKANLNNSSISYEILNQMKYLDMVVSEGFRKWPPITATDRICNKDFLMESRDGTTVIIKSGEGLFIPIYNIHNDPENYPNPSKFDPERFADENKDFIKPCSFMPFGLGPRNCIGSRFALMQIKTVLFNLLSKFSIEISENTQNPIKLKKNNVAALYPEIGFFVKLSSREQL